MTVEGTGDVNAVASVYAAEIDAWVRRAAEAEGQLGAIRRLSVHAATGPAEAMAFVWAVRAVLGDFPEVES